VSLTPRQVELADAALRIVARQGMRAVTFRSVAAESGWSLGAVQKAFATKVDLHAAMFARLRGSVGPAPTHEPGRPTLHAWLVELVASVLPLDERRRDLELQGAAFAELAAHDPEIAGVIAVRASCSRPADRVGGAGTRVPGPCRHTPLVRLSGIDSTLEKRPRWRATHDQEHTAYPWISS
jgi:AcrR family transcriptional regulator